MTLKQLEANRLNARRSTGPRTDAGKAVSRFNALKSGIDAQSETIPGEDPAQLEALVAQYRDRFDASTAERRMLVDALAHGEWELRRLRRAEAALWHFATMETERSFSSNDHAEGRVLNSRSREFERLQRRINATQRNYQAALRQLVSLDPATIDDSDPRPEPPAPPPQPRPPAPPEPAEPPSNEYPAIPTGFVPRFRPPVPHNGPSPDPERPKGPQV